MTVARPFPRISYRDALERYGIDKPDLRFGYEIRDLTALVGDDAAAVSTMPLAKGGRLRGILVRRGRRLCRKDLDALDRRGQRGQGGRTDLGETHRCRVGRAGRQGGRTRHCSTDSGGAEGDLLLAVAGADAVTSPALSAVRTALIGRRRRTAADRARLHLGGGLSRSSSSDPQTGQHVPRIIRSPRRIPTT